MDLPAALRFAGERHHGTLVTIGAAGRPQLSVIAYGLLGGLLRISVTDERVKTRNLRRDDRASLFVSGDSPWEWVVVEGTAELTDVARDPEGAVADELVELYRTVGGEHPDWDEFRRAMVSDHRLVIRIDPTRAYGILG